MSLISLAASRRPLGAVCRLAPLLLLLASCRNFSGPDRQESAGGLASARLPVPTKTAGPVVTVTNEYIDPVVSGVPNPVPEIMDVPPGTSLEFCWAAVPNGGGNIVSYRYGWDILDLNDPDQWEVDYTPYDGSEVCAPPRSFFFGTHTFWVEILDDQEARSRVGLHVNIVQGPPSFDFMKGTCRNPLSPSKKGLIQSVLPGTEGVDVHDIDVSSVHLWIDGHEVYPVRTRYGDIASPLINGDRCECPPNGTDRIADLILMFSAEEVVTAMGDIAGGDIVEVQLYGFSELWGNFGLVDCVTIVGPPGDGTKPLQLRDDVLETLERAYNERNFDDMNPLLDDDFVFFFSEQDFSSGKVPFAQWDRASELDATRWLFNPFVPVTEASVRRPLQKTAGQHVEDATWGRIKSLFLGDGFQGTSSIQLTLRYTPGEDAWVQVPGGTVENPWYAKVVSYFLLVEVGDVAFVTGNPYRGNFIVHYDSNAGHWRIVQWRDDI